MVNKFPLLENISQSYGFDFKIKNNISDFLDKKNRSNFNFLSFFTLTNFFMAQQFWRGVNSGRLICSTLV